MFIKGLSKVPRAVAGLASAEPALGYAMGLALEEGQRAVQRLFVAILAAGVVLLVFLGLAFGIELAVNALGQQIRHRLVREFFLARGFGQMALGGAIHLLGGVMGDFADILMTVHTLHPDMRALLKQGFVDVKQTEIAIFINAAQAAMLVAENAVQFVLGIGLPPHTEKKQGREKQNNTSFEG